MKRAVVTRHLREAALWLGAALGSLCLVLALLVALLDVRLLVFRSGSMSPEIGAGALAFAREVPAEDLAVGDVVSVIDARGSRVTHRIVDLERRGDDAVLTLQGDANPTPDAETYSADGAYRVAFDLPWVGHLASAADTAWGLMVCVAFVALLLVLAFGRGVWPKGRRRSTRPKRPTRPTRHRIAVAAMAGVLVVGSPVLTPTDTLAAFSDTAVVGSGALTALAVPGPTSSNCTTSGLLITTATVSWSPVGANYNYQAVLTNWSTGQVVREDRVAGTSVTYTSGLLSGLGSSGFLVTVRAYPAGAPAWVSGASVQTAIGYGLLGGAYCA